MARRLDERSRWQSIVSEKSATPVPSGQAEEIADGPKKYVTGSTVNWDIEAADRRGTAFPREQIRPGPQPGESNPTYTLIFLPPELVVADVFSYSRVAF